LAPSHRAEYRPQNPPDIPAHKENKHEAGCAKKFAPAQETKEAPGVEKVHGGEEIKGGGSVKG
jgi:hypothetical protein